MSSILVALGLPFGVWTGLNEVAEALCLRLDSIARSNHFVLGVHEQPIGTLSGSFVTV